MTSHSDLRRWVDALAKYVPSEQDTIAARQTAAIRGMTYAQLTELQALLEALVEHENPQGVAALNATLDAWGIDPALRMEVTQ
jgi:hypothetical protein